MKKANLKKQTQFWKAEVNLSIYSKREYVKMRHFHARKKQSQSNPIPNKHK